MWKCICIHKHGKGEGDTQTEGNISLIHSLHKRHNSQKLARTQNRSFTLEVGMRVVAEWKPSNASSQGALAGSWIGFRVAESIWDAAFASYQNASSDWLFNKLEILTGIAAVESITGWFQMTKTKIMMILSHLLFSQARELLNKKSGKQGSRLKH